MQVYTGAEAVAHNTYIQIITEWGLLLGGIIITLYVILLTYQTVFLKIQI